MKPAQFREMSDEHLRLTLNETIKHLFQLRFQSATERLETPSEIRKAKQDIARALGAPETYVQTLIRAKGRARVLRMPPLRRREVP